MFRLYFLSFNFSAFFSWLLGAHSCSEKFRFIPPPPLPSLFSSNCVPIQGPLGLPLHQTPCATLRLPSTKAFLFVSGFGCLVRQLEHLAYTKQILPIHDDFNITQPAHMRGTQTEHE